MQDMELYGLVAVLVLGLSAVAVRRRGADQLRSPRLQVLLGIVPGLLGALIILVPKIDVVPDPVEGLALLVPVLLVGALVVFRSGRVLSSRRYRGRHELPSRGSRDR